MQIAVLDDYQGVALEKADWASLERAGHRVQSFRDHIPDDRQDALLARLRDFDIVCVMRERTSIKAGLIDRLPKLKLIVTIGLSNPAIDIAHCTDRGVLVCGFLPQGRPPTAELAVALMMALARGIVTEHASVRAGGWQVGLGRMLGGSTLGVLGLGREGAAVARLGKALGMRVIAWSENLTPERAAECGAEHVDRDRLFAASDFLSVHLRLSERTRGLVGARELARMKPGAFLVNTAREPIVEKAALLDALATGRIAGAAIDVFAVEPLPPDDPYRRAANLITTPHIGFVTHESYDLVFPAMVDAITSFLDGDPQTVLTARPQDGDDARVTAAGRR